MMKKIFLFILAACALLCTAMGAETANIESGYYYILSKGSESKAMLNMNLLLGWDPLERGNPQFIFYLSSSGTGDNEYWMQSLADSSYFSVVPAYYVTQNSKDINERQALIFEKQDDGGFKIRPVNVRPDHSTSSYKEHGNFSAGNNWPSSGAPTVHHALAQWTGDSWHLEKVPDAELATARLKGLVALAVETYKNTFLSSTEETGLIGEVNPTDKATGAGSPFYTTCQQTSDNNSSFANLIDGNTKTYFQSSWTASVAPKPQWIQVDLGKDKNIKAFQLKLGLRDGIWGSDEQPADITLYGTNDESLAMSTTIKTKAQVNEQSGWTRIGEYNMPLDQAQTTEKGSWTGYTRITSSTASNRYITKDFFMPQGAFRYVRFYVNETVVPASDNRDLTFGEWQMYKINIDETHSPYSYVPALKDSCKRLLTMINRANDALKNTSGSNALIQDLQTAIEHVKLLTPQTSTLTDLISSVSLYVGKFGVGDELGDVTQAQWDTLQSAINRAETYYTGTPTAEEIPDYVANLQNAFLTFKRQQIKQKENTWYYIVNRDNTRLGNITEGGTGTAKDTWCYGNLMYASGVNTKASSTWSPLKWGYYDHLTGERQYSAQANPFAMWRFVTIDAASGTCALQNRATGTYIGVSANNNGNVGLDAKSTGYQVSLLKEGQIGFTCKDPTNTSLSALYADASSNVTTAQGGENTPAAWTLEEVDDDAIEVLEYPILDNSIQIMSLPYPYNDDLGYNAEVGIHTYVVKSMPNPYTLELTEKTSFEAGEPFIVVSNNYAQYDPINKILNTLCVPIPPVSAYSLESKTVGPLVATLDYTTVSDEGIGYFENSAIKTTGYDGKTSGAVGISGHSGYINLGNITNNASAATDLTIVSDNRLTGVGNILTNETLQKGNVNVYTPDGKLVRRGVNIGQATRGLSRGIYIVGKKKVAVQ